MTTTADPAAKTRNEEAAIMRALDSVMDPELGMSVNELALIRVIDFGADPVTISMVLTTPFCPYGPELIAEVGQTAAEALGRPVGVKLLAERWDPKDAGLEW